MKKNIKELKKIMEEIAKIESESLRAIEKISNKIKKERRA